MKPSMEVYSMKQGGILCYSGKLNAPYYVPDFDGDERSY